MDLDPKPIHNDNPSVTLTIRLIMQGKVSLKNFLYSANFQFKVTHGKSLKLGVFSIICQKIVGIYLEGT